MFEAEMNRELTPLALFRFALLLLFDRLLSNRVLNIDHVILERYVKSGGVPPFIFDLVVRERRQSHKSYTRLCAIGIARLCLIAFA